MKDSIEKVKKIIDEKTMNGRAIISIDGPCGSGKTTFADKLNTNLEYNIVHMDDFYLPFQKRDKNWMNIIAGHMDFNRLIDTTLLPYKKQVETNYISYDCHSDKYLQKIPIDLSKPLILEGSYSSHPTLNEYVDLKIFMEIDDKEQIIRLTKRNKDLVDKFVSMWIPFENRYFLELNIKEKSDIII